MANNRGNRIILVSELGEYSFCRYSWYMRRVKGVDVSPETRAALAKGIENHEVHGRSVQEGRQHKKLSGVFMIWGIILLVIILLGKGII